MKTEWWMSKGQPVSFGRWFFEFGFMLMAAFALAVGIRTFVIQPFVVPTGSMQPTIEIQDRVVANKFVYWFREPEVGDIVVLNDPRGQVDTLIKRVVAVSGQTVDLVDGRVVVDGVVLDEPYTYGKPSEPMVVEMPYTVPEGMVWLMGDNRTNSSDSRVFGPVSVEEVEGAAFWTFWPLDRFGVLE